MAVVSLVNIPSYLSFAEKFYSALGEKLSAKSSRRKAARPSMKGFLHGFLRPAAESLARSNNFVNTLQYVVRVT